MAIRVQELLDLPHLRLELVAGASGVGRTVTWAHASDLPDPWSWLAGGELLMKNGRSLPRSTVRQVEFIERLAEASVAALVIGTDPMTPAFSERAARRAEQLRLAVLRVPYSMSFIAISRAVADAAQTHSRRLARTERIYAAIQFLPDGPDAGTGFLQRLEVELGGRLHLLDPGTLRPALAGTRGASEALVADLRQALSAYGPPIPAVLHLPVRGRRRAVVVDVPYDEPTLLVAERSDDVAFDLPTLHHAATAAAIGLAGASLRAELEAELRGASLGRWLSLGENPARADPPPGDPGPLAGFDLTLTRLLAARPAGEGAARGVGVALRRRDVRHLLLVRGDVLWLLTESPDTSLDALDTRLPAGAAIGSSRPLLSPSRLPEAAREALFAAGNAARAAMRTATFGPRGYPQSVFALRDPREAEALVDAVLGPVLAYDARHGTELTGSLATFLACRRSWSRTAEVLHVHRQTVIYRLGKVATLTGRNLAETADIAELWGALVARELLAPPGSAPEHAGPPGHGRSTTPLGREKATEQSSNPPSAL